MDSSADDGRSTPLSAETRLVTAGRDTEAQKGFERAVALSRTPAEAQEESLWAEMSGGQGVLLRQGLAFAGC